MEGPKELKEFNGQDRGRENQELRSQHHRSLRTPRWWTCQRPSVPGWPLLLIETPTPERASDQSGSGQMWARIPGWGRATLCEGPIPIPTGTPQRHIRASGWPSRGQMAHPFSPSFMPPESLPNCPRTAFRGQDLKRCLSLPDELISSFRFIETEFRDRNGVVSGNPTAWGKGFNQNWFLTDPSLLVDNEPEPRPPKTGATSLVLMTRVASPPNPPLASL